MTTNENVSVLIIIDKTVKSDRKKIIKKVERPNP